ncbi:unnamed protein product [Agarophyton chilense]
MTERSHDVSPITISLPVWYDSELDDLPSHFGDDADKMRVVLHFARLNVQHKSGGPFAAAVFEQHSNRLLSIGVNRVEANHNSSAHAEVVALSLAQRAACSYDLGGNASAPTELVVNWRPCAMCLGATLWSGVRRVVIAGEGDELQTITGFDEGPVHPEWRDELRRRGVLVKSNVLRLEAVKVFEQFANSGNFVYNARLG